MTRRLGDNNADCFVSRLMPIVSSPRRRRTNVVRVEAAHLTVSRRPARAAFPRDDVQANGKSRIISLSPSVAYCQNHAHRQNGQSQIAHWIILEVGTNYSGGTSAETAEPTLQLADIGYHYSDNGRNDRSHLHVGVAAATSPDVARDGPGPTEDRSQRLGVSPRFNGEQRSRGTQPLPREAAGAPSNPGEPRRLIGTCRVFLRRRLAAVQRLWMRRWSSAR